MYHSLKFNLEFFFIESNDNLKYRYKQVNKDIDECLKDLDFVLYSDEKMSCSLEIDLDRLVKIKELIEENAKIRGLCLERTI